MIEARNKDSYAKRYSIETVKEGKQCMQDAAHIVQVSDQPKTETFFRKSN